MTTNLTEVVKQNYDKIFQDGKLVNINVCMWGMSHQLSSEDVQSKINLPDIYKLGRKYLIKPEVYNKFKQAEQKARNYLYSKSFPFPLVPQAHFVPKSIFHEVYQKLWTMRGEYEALTNEFIEKYEAYKEETLAFYIDHAESLRPFYPTVDKLRNRFSFTISAFEIAFPQHFEEFDLQKEVEREEAVSEAKDAANTEYHRQLQEHMSKMDEFVNSVSSTLRTKVAQQCRIVVDKINGGEVVTPVSIKALLRHVDEFRKMNFIGDTQAEVELQSILSLLDGTRAPTEQEALAMFGSALNEFIEKTEEISDRSESTGEYLRKIEI